DGRFLAGIHHSVWLWDVSTGKFLALRDNLQHPAAVAFSPDSKILAAGGGPILLWNVSTRQQLLHFAGELMNLGQPVIYSNGKTLAALSREEIRSTDPLVTKPGSVTTWAVATGKQLSALEKIAPCALFQDGARYTLKGTDGRIHIHDLTKKVPSRTLTG